MKDIVEGYNKIWILPKNDYLNLKTGSIIKVKTERAYLEGTVAGLSYNLSQEDYGNPFAVKGRYSNCLSANLSLNLVNVRVIKENEI